MDQVSLNFSKIEVDYLAQDEKGITRSAAKNGTTRRRTPAAKIIEHIKPSRSARGVFWIRKNYTVSELKSSREIVCICPQPERAIPAKQLCANRSRIGYTIGARPALDYSPRETQEPAKSRSASIRDLRQSVRRDLEWLLNTRCHTEDIDDSLLEARRSVAFYGLPDFTGMSAKNSNEQRRLTKALENSLKIFEPRFRELKISMEPMNHVDRQMKFRIEARLHVESASGRCIRYRSAGGQRRFCGKRKVIVRGRSLTLGSFLTVRVYALTNVCWFMNLRKPSLTVRLRP